MSAILRIQGISKHFPGVQALNDVSFDVERGSIHAILGENGAGKSTLMQIIAGVQQPDSGSLEFDNLAALFSNPKEAQSKGIAIVYQELNLAPNLTIAENIFLGLEPRLANLFLDSKTLRKQSSLILNRLRIHLDPDTVVGHLTVGQQQLIEICKSLVRKPRLLILDEPTSSLSESESEILFRVISDLQSHGVTVIYITHRLAEVFTLCDTLTILRDGKHVRTTKVAVTTEAEVVRLMVGRELLRFHRHTADKRGEIVLEVKGLTREGQYEAVSFYLCRGEIVAMAGLVGAGRSETALGIFGSPRPDRGEVWLNGKRLDVQRPEQAMRAGIAFVPEDRKTMGLVLGSSVGTNISMASLRRLARGKFVDRRAELALIERFVTRLNVRTPGYDQRTSLLSGGNQQKVLVAKWLAVQPKVLIVDEPTRGVDIGTKAELYSLLDQLAQEGLAILVISSDLPEVLALADRVLVMRQGKLTGELERGETTEEKIMSLAALGSEG
jgi:ABC-type sugar transport system ATPase subunit